MNDTALKEIEYVKKLLKLSNTSFVIDPTIESGCDTYTTPPICYIKNPNDIIHEGVHAHFEERGIKLWEQLGPEKYSEKISSIVTDEHLEEVVARIIETNHHKIPLNKCILDQTKVVEFIAKNPPYADIKTGSKIMRLYGAVYDFNCTLPEDVEFIENVKEITDPVKLYNKIAKYVGAQELIDE